MTTGLKDQFTCSNCGSMLNSDAKIGGICYCESCGAINVLPGKEHTADSLAHLDDANKELYNSDFYKAFNSFRQTAQIDRKNSEIYFCMALASNQIKYVYDLLECRFQPVCYDPVEKEFALDTNVVRAVQNAESESLGAEYESRASEIDKIKGKFRSYLSAGLKYDVFISVVSPKGSVEEMWANELYDGMKAAGLTPFCPQRDGANDADGLTLYALCSSKLFVLVCGDEELLATNQGKRDYVRFNQTLSGTERSRGSILVACGGNKINSLPSVLSEVKAVDIYSSDSVSSINEFVKPIKNVKIKLKGEAVSSFAPSAAVKCMRCGEEIPNYMAVGGGCHCMNCNKSVALPRKGQRREVITLLNEGAHHLSRFEFDRAYQSYAKAGRLDPLEPLAFFGGALAKNKINFIFDPKSGEYVAMSLGSTKNSSLSYPGVVAALALATDEQKTVFKQIIKEIDRTREQFRGFMSRGLYYNVFMCVGSRGIDNLADEWAWRFCDKVNEDRYSIYYEPKEYSTDYETDPLLLKLYAMRCADSFIVACENELELCKTSAVDDCVTYQRIHRGEENNSDICVVSKNADVKEIPGVERKIINFGYTGRDDVAILEELAKQREAKPDVKYCAICESEVLESKKLCPRCFSFIFNKSPLSSVKTADKPFFKKISEFKNKALEWIADHARIFILALVALVLVLTVGLASSGISNLNVKTLNNDEYDVTVSSKKRIFDKNSPLYVSEITSGTTYQWIKNRIGREIGNEVGQMVIYTIEYGREYDGMLTVKIPIHDMLSNVTKEDILICQVFENSYLEPISGDISKGCISFETEALGKFAIFEITDYPISNDDGEDETLELYELLQQVEAIDRSLYTPYSLEALDQAYNEAISVFSMSSASNDEIENALNYLQQAIDDLVDVADISMLLSLINRVDDERLMRKNRYTENSINNLTYSYNNALAVIEDKNSTQNDVDRAYEDLLYDIEHMTKIRTPFGTALVVLITVALLIGFSVIGNSYDMGAALQVIVWIVTIIVMIVILTNMPEWPFWKVVLAEVGGVIALAFIVLSMFGSSD